MQSIISARPVLKLAVIFPVTFWLAVAAALNAAGVTF